jgi:hypothetical protein
MNAKAITPILNVSDIIASFTWFEKWGWRKCWDWGTPPTFGSVGSGECEIFLCLGGQGSRGRGTNAATFGPGGDETADKGAWMSVWVDDVDEVHRQCVAAGLDITFPPTDMPWNASARCTCGTRTATCFEWAKAFRAQTKNEAAVPGGGPHLNS